MNCKTYRAKPVTPELAESYRSGKASLYMIARKLKRDETGIRNELAAMGVPIRKRGDKTK